MNDSEELAEKYHKLFQDYTRIKAQHAVLKKAVLKEQTENAAIQAAMKEKEQEARKSLQDLDLLSFHNQRLTKRIENLQNLATTKSGSSWLMGGGSVKKELEKSQTTLEAATIDLQAKIEENEKLHQQLYEINALYPRHVTELQGKIQTLEKQNQELQVDVQRAGVANEDTITMIRKEKNDVEKELGLIRDALAGQLHDEQKSNQSLRDRVQKLEEEIDRLNKVDQELENLQREHRKLAAELETFKWISSELSQLQDAYNSLEREKAQIEKAHAQLSQNHETLRQSEEALRRALSQEQDSSRALHEKTQHLNRDIKAVRGEALERERGHANRISELESELDSVRKEQGHLKAQYEELKMAEQSAKEGETRSKADLARDKSEMETSLKDAEARVKDLEVLQSKLEKELADTRTAFEETKAALLVEQQKSGAEPTLKSTIEVDTKADETLATEDGPETEEESAEKEAAPLSKKARKKKAAAAAAAAAAAVAATPAGSESTKKDNDSAPKESEKDGKEESQVDAAEEEQRRKELEAAQKETEAMKAEIESLRSQIEASRESSTYTSEKLSKTQAELNDVVEEKQTLTHTLEMHVEITLQLQQEIDRLMAELADTQIRVGSPATGGTSAAVKEDEDEEEEPLIRHRTKSAQGSKSSQTSPNLSTSTSANVATNTAVDDEVVKEKKVGKDESTQVHVRAEDKAVQVEKVVAVDESTQADIPLVKDAAVSPLAVSEGEMAGKESKESKESKEGKEGKAGNANKKSSVGEKEMEDAFSKMQTVPFSVNQSNREHLIKQHYETKLQNVTEQLQVSDGRYARLHREFGMLKELLMETVKEKETMAKEMEGCRRQLEMVQEELVAAKEDNRAQVETMTNFMKSLDQGR